MIRPLLVGPILLLAPAVPAAADSPAVETTVRMSGPERALVETRIRSAAISRSPAFHGLSRSGAAGWRRAEMAFERDAAGTVVFRGEAAADPDGWLRIPIPLPDSSPPPGTDLSFRATITPPIGYRIADPFPARAGPENSGGEIAMALPAPPSLLRFRVIPDGASGFGLPVIVDGIVVLLLLGLAAFGALRFFRPGVPASL